MSRKLTNEYVDQKIIEQNRDLIRIGNISAARKLNEWECLNCQHRWFASVSNVFHLNHPTKCPKCYGKNKITNEDVDRILIEKDIPIIRISEIIKCGANSTWECLDCKHIWTTTPNKILNVGRRCPKCNISNGENKVEKILKEFNVNSVWQKFFNNCRNPKTNRMLPFDFYLPKYNYCIEYDGTFHYSPSFLKENGIRYHSYHTQENYEYNKYKDNIKNMFCENNKINLIRIPFTEYKNIRDIIVRELKFQ